MWLGLTDLGLGGNALINALAEAHGREDQGTAKDLISTAFSILSAIATLLIVAGLFFASGVPWPAVFNVAAVGTRELALSVECALLGFALALPLSVAVGVANGYQFGYLANAWSAVASIAMLAATYGVTRTDWGLPGLLLATWGARLLCSAACAFHVARWLAPSVRPGIRTSKRAARRLLSLGSRYALGHIGAIGLFYSQPMIVSQALGPSHVGVFNVAYRLLSIPLLVVQMLSFPLMPAYGEARAKRDWTWIRRTLRSSLAVALLVPLLLGAPLALFARSLIHRWVGANLVPDQTLVIALFFYVLVNSLLTPLSVMLFGVERVTGQALIAVATAFATVLGGIYLVGRLGLAGMALAMALSMLLVNGTGQALELARTLEAGDRQSARPVG